jgi:rubredoxin
MTDRRCRGCKASLDGVFEQHDRLSTLGYLHTDVHVDCPECGMSHTFGIPVEPGPDRRSICPVCGGRRFPYKVNPDARGGDWLVHWKCEDCWYFQTKQPSDRREGIVYLGVEKLVGRVTNEG